MKRAIVLTAGHGGKDCGAVNGNVTEAEIVTDARNIIKFYLNLWSKQDGVQIDVLTDGTGNQNLPLKTALSLMNNKGDLKLELHCNAANLITAGGVEALANEEHKKICQELCAAVSDVLKIKIRGSAGGWKPANSGQHRRLAVCEKGGIVLELFFISNNVELKKWQARKWVVCKKIATILYCYAKGGK